MNDDELLRRYLLGELPEAEVERLESRLLEDDALFELAEAVEADLLAACARGELAPAERERVLLRLASSPQGRERLALARGLTSLAPRSTVVPFPVRTPPLARPAVRWAAAAAALVAVAGGSWFALHEIRTLEKGQRIAEEIQPPPIDTPENPVVPPPPDTPAVIVEKKPPVPTPEPPERAVPVIAKKVITLALGVLRDTGDLQKFEIEPEVQQVEIQVDLTTAVGYESFSASLRNTETGKVWENNELEPRQVDGYLVLGLPAGELPDGIYELKIQFVDPDGQPGEVLPEFEVVHVS